MIAAVIFVVFPFAMAYAAFSDLVSMTIANRVSIILLAAFVVLALVVGMPLSSIGLHLGVGLATLVVAFGCFAAGWMGGGDAKLLAATAVWFGPTQLFLDYLVLGAVFGGVLTLAILLARAKFVPVTGVDFVDHLLERKTGIPYGIGLGAAGLTVYTSSDWVSLAVHGLV
ncbi:A24 family peptidase [Aureimonas glaciei]|uniref:Peptidase n=1 Tax=Aureimonas glaciei TaxID=1776957 RepID=A0A916XT23_9HYPH|nr:prepilin peptidase [Aureimonas glaciei]GGD05378.1 peptidase [Aureimonas glaciei]